MKMRTFSIWTLICACLIFTGCFSILGGKKNKNTDLSGFIDGELGKFFGQLDDESKTLFTDGESN